MKHLGICGPIAWDQFLVEVSGEDIYFQPKWGGCALNQALNFYKLCAVYNKPYEAFLISSVGPDFNEIEAKFQGRSRRNVLSLLKNIQPVLHDSTESTTSFVASLPLSDKSASLAEEIIKSGRHIDKRLESQLRSFEQEYLMRGTSINDLGDKQTVTELLRKFDEYPRIMSIAGGTFEMQSGIIKAIRNYEVSEKKPHCFLVYDPGPIIHFLEVNPQPAASIQNVRELLSKVDILKTNKKENYVLRGGKSRGLSSLLNYVSVVIVTSSSKVSVYVKDGKIIDRTDFLGLPLIKTETTGAGDIFTSSLLFHLYERQHITRDDILESVPFAMSSALNYLSEKKMSREVGIPDYYLSQPYIEAARKKIRKHDRPPYRMR